MPVSRACSRRLRNVLMISKASPPTPKTAKGVREPVSVAVIASSAPPRSQRKFLLRTKHIPQTYANKQSNAMEFNEISSFSMMPLYIRVVS